MGYLASQLSPCNKMLQQWLKNNRNHIKENEVYRVLFDKMHCIKGNFISSYQMKSGFQLIINQLSVSSSHNIIEELYHLKGVDISDIKKKHCDELVKEIVKLRLQCKGD